MYDTPDQTIRRSNRTRTQSVRLTGYVSFNDQATTDEKHYFLK